MEDKAESGVLAEVLLIAGVIGAALLLFLLTSGNEPEAPPAVGLTDDGAQTGGTKTFTVAATATSARWGDVSVLLDSRALTYSTALATDNTYCIALAAGTCAANDATRQIAAGQQLMIHHTTLTGKTLQLRHDEGNQLLYAKILSG